jgi:formamidopyrimidine-DNA glycosylase
MPELPEVETVRRGLSEMLPGHTIADVSSDWTKSFPNDIGVVRKYLIGAKVTQVNRRAKVLLIELNTNYTLVTHLKMTGQLVFRGKGGEHFGAGHPTNSLVGELPDKSTRVTLFMDHGNLFFNDQRKFGWMKLLPTPEVPNIDFMQKVGPEPLEPAFTYEVFKARLFTRPNSIIKAVLLDQAVIAGIGNIYADESLFAAKIHPEMRVSDIPGLKLKVLYRELLAVLLLSIEKGGSTDKNYVNAEGKKGSYLTFAKVFRREGKPCVVCGTTILKIRVAGRGTHICPKCQRLTRSK